MVITKKFGEYPFSHRQPAHDGHCRLIHGHNWTFEISFHCKDEDRDENGFVLDFGKLNFLKKSLEDLFDHTIVLPHSDLDTPEIMALANAGLAKISWIDDVSCEGLAKFVYDLAERFLISEGHYDRGVRVDNVVVWEDLKNSASFSGV